IQLPSVSCIGWRMCRPMKYRGRRPETRTAQNYPETEDRVSLCHPFDRGRSETRRDQDRRVPRSQAAQKAALSQTTSRVSSYLSFLLGNKQMTTDSGLSNVAGL